MARATAKKAEKDINQTELLFEPKRDINPYWSSSLFSDVYLKNDFPREYSYLWQNDENSGFTKFYQGFVDLCVDLDGESFKNWREADTVKNWIVPVMELLGWENNSKRQQNSYIDNTSFTVEENGKKQVYRPDLIYFDRPEFKAYTQDQKEINEKLREIRSKKTGAQVVVEAKYWDRLSALSDKVKKSQETGDSASSLGPELQTLKYMDLFHLDYGILTDGKTWKLLHRELSQGVPNRSFEFDLGPLMELALKLGSENNEAKFSEYSKYFYYFFSKESFCETKLLDRVLEYSKKYASRIEEDLKERFIASMGVICNSLKNTADSLKIPYNLDLVRNVAESHLFNILFVKSCEVRHILPVKSPNYIKISLHEVVESLSEMEFDPDKKLDTFLNDFQFGSTFGGKKFDWDGFEIFDRFINLYEIIHDGTSASKDFGFEIQGFKESIFSVDEWKFAMKAKVCNKDMVNILFNLNFIKSEFPQRKYQQIPYSYFTPRQLGSIYESFLEYKLKEASTDLVYNNKEWKEGNPNSRKVIEMNLSKDFVVKKGDLYFDTDNMDRKKTGSYYTPDQIVNFILEQTLNPIVKNLSSKQLLELKVCDPAMGSGHFLSGALDFLTKVYREKLSDEALDDVGENFQESARRILDSCIFGIDLNPRAVKLAKMSLWLMTAYTGQKLERLDDQLICTNTLKASLDKVWNSKFKFDVIIGNPPYAPVDAKGDIEFYQKNFKHQDYQLDLYLLFLEKYSQLIKDGGTLGVIVSNTWLQSLKLRKIRTHLVETYKWKHLLHCVDKIFDATVGTHVIVFEKRSSNTKIKKDVELKISFLENGSIHYSHAIPNAKLPRDGSPINIKVEEDIQSLFANLTRGTTALTTCFKVYSGITPFEKGKGLPKQTEEIMKTKPYVKEGKRPAKNWSPLLRGSLINQYRNLWDNDYWVLYGENLAAPRDPKIFEAPEKLVVRQTGDSLIATFVPAGFIARKNLHIILPKNNNYSIYLLLGLINSSLYDFFYYVMNPEKAQAFAEVKMKHVEMLPIPMLENTQGMKSSISDEIIKLVKDVLDRFENGSKECTDLIGKIDDLVFNLYDVDTKSRKFIQKTIESFRTKDDLKDAG